ncbi:fructuronate reductase [Providencia sp. 21OH12SH02B-Prov]|uniref:fructuronate reductase n=1 Tax=Providencia sp. 21OH12SH02B-Prov TaxID=3015951 RepID=UPI0022B6063A|nr:fructuronate reductase [Providencia sp. 21OH12SH02B-Prov]WBA55335.1 fructuronate reductase [Providencia sp. 21OH12SH02B-Prov]
MKNKLAMTDPAIVYPNWTTDRLTTRMVHLGCGAFHRAHQALYMHLVLEKTQSDWGYCEVNLMSVRNIAIIEALKAQSMQYAIVEKGPSTTALKVIGSMKEAMHPLIDGVDAIIEKMASPDISIISLTITEKGYCIDPVTGQLDLNNELIKQDITTPDTPRSAIGFITAALKRRFERQRPPFSVLSCDNVRDNGHMVRRAVIGLASLQDRKLSEWIEQHVTFPCTVVDRIVPAVTEESTNEMTQLLGKNDRCAVICEPFKQWIIEDNFVHGRPEWELAGAKFVRNVKPFELMKLRLLNGSHSFLAYLGYLGGYTYIADTMDNPDYRNAVRKLMLNEQAMTVTVSEDIDFIAYTDSFMARFTNRALRHQTWQIAMDGSQKLPQRLLDSVLWHLEHGTEHSCLVLGIAGWMRYISGIDEQGNTIDIRDPLKKTFAAIYAKHGLSVGVVEELLAIESIFDKHLANNPSFITAVKLAYQKLLDVGARQAVATL